MRVPMIRRSTGTSSRVGIFMLTWILISLSIQLAGPWAWAAEPRSTIGGTVYRDERRDGRATGQRGVEGVVIQLSGESRDEHTRTDARGGYTFDDLKAGTYRVSLVPPRGHEPTANETLRVTADGKSTYRSLDFGVAPVRPTPSPTASATRSPSPTPTAPPVRRRATQSVAAPSPSPAAMPAAGDPAEAEQSPPDAGPGEHPGDRALAGDVPTATGTPRLPLASLPLRYAPGRSRASQIAGWASGDIISLGVPFRSQLDSTDFALVNCGPASLAMVLAAFGIEIEPAAIRDYVNYLSGDADPEDGTSLDYLARVAREAGLATLDVYGGGGYRTWTLEAVRAHVRSGRPVVTLTRYQSLPGHAESASDTDHYIVITGVSGDDFIYNDGAFAGPAGYGLLISGPDLERAWQASTIPSHAMALDLAGPPAVPPWIAAHQAPEPTPLGEPDDGSESQQLPQSEAERWMAELAQAAPTASPAPLRQLTPAAAVSAERTEIAAAGPEMVSPAPPPPQERTEAEPASTPQVNPFGDVATNRGPSPWDLAGVGPFEALLVAFLLLVVGPRAARRRWTSRRSLTGFLQRWRRP